MTKSKTSEDPKWKLVEKVIAILEKAISPNSHIEHNKKLLNLNSSTGKKRQCDVVIKSGIPLEKYLLSSRFKIEQKS